MPVEVYYYENSYTLRGTKFIKNGTKLQEKLGQIVYNKFRPANCSHGYEVPIWIPFHIRSASKFKNDRQVPAGCEDRRILPARAMAIGRAAPA